MLLRFLILAPLAALYGLWGWVCRKVDRGTSWVVASRRNTVLFLVISLLTTLTVLELVTASLGATQVVAALVAPPGATL